MDDSAADVEQRPEFGGWRRERTKPQKTAMIVARSIVREIIQQGSGPGTRLPAEQDMMQQYRVGRGTLREALRYLELQGVLEIKPGLGGGPIVRQPDSRHLASTFALLMQFAGTPFHAVVDARIVVEPALAAEAARNITAEHLEQLRSSVDRMGQRIADRDVFLAENDRFHSLLAFASGNPIFGHLQASLHWITDGTVLGVEYPERRRKDVLRAHDRICAAIENRDTDEARKLMSLHMENFRAYLERNYPEMLQRQLSWSDFAE